MLHKHLLVALIAATATTPLIADDSNQGKRDFQPATYCLYDMGRLPGMPVLETHVTIAAINNRNQIVGTITHAGSEQQAYVWQRAGGMRALGVLPDQTAAEAADINDAGRVVGSSFNPDAQTVLSFIWDKRNGMRALDASLGGGRHSATSINRFGQVAGSSETTTGATHAYFRDRNGDVFDLGVLPGGNPETFATAVNDHGFVVGGDSGPQISDAFIWDERNGIRRLVEPRHPLVIFPNAINNRGQVVGGILGDTTRAFLWTARDGLQDLGSLPGGSDSDFAEAFDINRWGTIVGATQLPAGPGQAFVWDKRSGMRNLNDLLDRSSALAPHVALRGARAINDFGLIAAEGIDLRDPSTDRGQTHGYLLAPRRHPGRPPCG